MMCCLFVLPNLMRMHRFMATDAKSRVEMMVRFCRLSMLGLFSVVMMAIAENMWVPWQNSGRMFLLLDRYW